MRFPKSIWFLESLCSNMPWGCWFSTFFNFSQRSRCFNLMCWFSEFSDLFKSPVGFMAVLDDTFKIPHDFVLGLPLSLHLLLSFLAVIDAVVSFLLIILPQSPRAASAILRFPSKRCRRSIPGQCWPRNCFWVDFGKGCLRNYWLIVRTVRSSQKKNKTYLNRPKIWGSFRRECTFSWIWIRLRKTSPNRYDCFCSCNSRFGWFRSWTRWLNPS